MPVPLPLPIALRPQCRQQRGYLFIATSDELIDDALAVKSGQKTGLKATAEFKHLARRPARSRQQFCYMSQRFVQNLDAG